MSLVIRFNNSDGKHTAGDVISGTITINNDVPLVVTGLKVTVFIQCRIVTLVNSNGKSKTSNRIHPLLVENLNKEFLGGTKTKEKLLQIGYHSIPFAFKPLKVDYPSSFEGDKIFCRYSVRVDMDVNPNKVMNTTRSFKVCPLPLDRNPAAIGWQTKTTMKVLKLPTKRISMKVTLPTGIDRRETVPIYISLSNDSKYPFILIRSKLICKIRLPKDVHDKDIKITANENQEQLNLFNGDLTHYLKVHTGFSFKCPLVAEKFRIEIEVGTADGTKLKLDFPVIVGVWKDGPGRGVVANGCVSSLPELGTSMLAVRVAPPPSYEDAMQAGS